MNLRSESAQGAHRLRDRFREQTIEAVLGAAETVFAVHGLEGASMGQIAEKAGVAVGTLYNHFEDREALLGALLERLQAEVLDRLDRRRKELSERPFREQLDGFLTILFDHFERHRAFSDIALVCPQAMSSKKSQTMRALYDRAETIIKIGQREKGLRADPLRSFPAMLLGLVRSTLLREKYGASRLDPAVAVAAVSDFFLRGAAR